MTIFSFQKQLFHTRFSRIWKINKFKIHIFIGVMTPSPVKTRCSWSNCPSSLLLVFVYSAQNEQETATQRHELICQEKYNELQLSGATLIVIWWGLRKLDACLLFGSACLLRSCCILAACLLHACCVLSACLLRAYCVVDACLMHAWCALACV